MTEPLSPDAAGFLSRLHLPPATIERLGIPPEPPYRVVGAGVLLPRRAATLQEWLDRFPGPRDVIDDPRPSAPPPAASAPEEDPVSRSVWVTGPGGFVAEMSEKRARRVFRGEISRG